MKKRPYAANKVPCTVCKKTLYRTPHLASRSKNGNFCTQRCFALFRSKKLTGINSAVFKNGTRITNKKYTEVLAKWHPFARNGYIIIHRLIVEAREKRFLKRDEVVHHLDGDHNNNHWDNLVVLSQNEHARIHMKERKRGKNGRVI